MKTNQKGPIGNYWIDINRIGIGQYLQQNKAIKLYNQVLLPSWTQIDPVAHIDAMKLALISQMTLRGSANRYISLIAPGKTSYHVPRNTWLWWCPGKFTSTQSVHIEEIDTGFYNVADTQYPFVDATVLQLKVGNQNMNWIQFIICTICIIIWFINSIYKTHDCVMWYIQLVALRINKNVIF